MQTKRTTMGKNTLYIQKLYVESFVDSILAESVMELSDEYMEQQKEEKNTIGSTTLLHENAIGGSSEAKTEKKESKGNTDSGQQVKEKERTQFLSQMLNMFKERM